MIKSISFLVLGVVALSFGACACKKPVVTETTSISTTYAK